MGTTVRPTMLRAHWRHLGGQGAGGFGGDTQGLVEGSVLRMKPEPPESLRNAMQWRGSCAQWVPPTPGCLVTVGTHRGFAGMRAASFPPPLLCLAPASRGSPAPLHAAALRASAGRQGFGFFRLAASALSPSSRVAVRVGQAAGCLEEPGLCRCSFQAPSSSLPSRCFFQAMPHLPRTLGTSGFAELSIFSPSYQRHQTDAHLP